jgi:hypothetical protein
LANNETSLKENHTSLSKYSDKRDAAHMKLTGEEKKKKQRQCSSPVDGRKNWKKGDPARNDMNKESW